jgi:phosphohistidine phosphatase SixA
MLITAITHASARDKDHNFRGLTAEGQTESERAAARYQALTAGRSVPAIQWVISSPKPRCLETVILLTKGLANEEVEASSVDIDGGLAAGSIEGDELATLAATGEVAHLLVSGHADLVKTLPDSARLRKDAARDGWFQTRPVLFQIEIEPGRPWTEAEIHFCESLEQGAWNNLLQADG